MLQPLQYNYEWILGLINFSNLCFIYFNFVPEAVDSLVLGAWNTLLIAASWLDDVASVIATAKKKKNHLSFKGSGSH